MHKRDQIHFLKCLVSMKSSTYSLLQEEWRSLHVFGYGCCHFLGNSQGNRISLGSTHLFLSRYLVVVVPPLFLGSLRLLLFLLLPRLRNRRINTTYKVKRLVR